jgi:hypothetical protein
LYLEELNLASREWRRLKGMVITLAEAGSASTV